MAKQKTTARLNETVKAYIAAQAAQLDVSESQLINAILDAHMRSTPMVERSIEQAAADLQRQIAETASANHAEVVGLLTAALEALLKLIEQSSGQAKQPSTAAQRAALFQPNTN